MKRTTMIYWALAVGQLVLGVITYVLVSIGWFGTPDYTLAMTFQKIALFFIPGAMAAGYFVFKSQLSRIDPKLSLDEKLQKYFSLIIVRGALFEAAFIYCCMAALVTSVLLFLWIAPIVFLVFLLMRPTPEGVSSDLQLSPADRNKLTQS